MAALQTWFQESGKLGRAPHDIHVFQRALRFKMDPEEVKLYDEDVLQVADIMGKHPSVVKSWSPRNRAWLLITRKAQELALPEIERRQK